MSASINKESKVDNTGASGNRAVTSGAGSADDDNALAAIHLQPREEVQQLRDTMDDSTGTVEEDEGDDTTCSCNTADDSSKQTKQQTTTNVIQQAMLNTKPKASCTSNSVKAGLLSKSATSTFSSGGAKHTKVVASASSMSSNNNSNNTTSRNRFPDKLHRLLEDCSADPNESHIVSWIQNRAFKVHHRKLFAATILPRYFDTTTYKSFQRNLNLWGFSCIAKGPERGICYHRYFTRGNEGDLSSQIKRCEDSTKLPQQRDPRFLLPTISEGGGNTPFGGNADRGLLALTNAGHSSLPTSADLLPFGGMFSMVAAPAAALPNVTNSFRPVSTHSNNNSAFAVVPTTSTGRKIKITQRGKKGSPTSPSSNPNKKRKATVKLVKQESQDSGPKKAGSDSDEAGFETNAGRMSERQPYQNMLPTGQQGHGSNRSFPIEWIDRGINLEKLLTVAGGKDWNPSGTNYSGSRNDLQQLIAMDRNRRTVIDSNLQQLLGGDGNSGASASSDMQRLLDIATSQNDTVSGAISDNAHLQQILALAHGGVGDTRDVNKSTINTRSLIDLGKTSEISRIQQESVGGGFAAGISPHLAMLIQQEKQQVQARQQAQLSSSGSNAEIVRLLAALQGTHQAQISNELLLHQLDEAERQKEQNQPTSSTSSSSIDQQVAQEQKALQDALQRVQQHRQQLLSLQLQREHIQNTSLSAGQPSLQQLLEQLQGPPPLRLPPSAAASQSSSSSVALSTPQNVTLQQHHELTQILKQQGFSDLNTGVGGVGGGASPHLQQLLQVVASLGGSQTAAPNPPGSSILEAIQRQQQQQQQQQQAATVNPQNDNITQQHMIQILQGRRGSFEGTPDGGMGSDRK